MRVFEFIWQILEVFLLGNTSPLFVFLSVDGFSIAGELE